MPRAAHRAKPRNERSTRSRKAPAVRRAASLGRSGTGKRSGTQKRSGSPKVKVELTDAERELLKHACQRYAAQLPSYLISAQDQARLMRAILRKL